MRARIQDLQKLHQEIEVARAGALRLGNPTLHTILTMSLLAVEDNLAKLEEDYVRTLPQVEALKKLMT